jgi:hypothetical protein
VRGSEQENEQKRKKSDDESGGSIKGVEEVREAMRRRGR